MLTRLAHLESKDVGNYFRVEVLSMGQSLAAEGFCVYSLIMRPSSTSSLFFVLADWELTYYLYIRVDSASLFSGYSSC